VCILHHLFVLQKKKIFSFDIFVSIPNVVYFDCYEGDDAPFQPTQDYFDVCDPRQN
jgi:hypothetical protein